MSHKCPRRVRNRMKYFSLSESSPHCKHRHEISLQMFNWRLIEAPLQSKELKELISDFFWIISSNTFCTHVLKINLTLIMEGYKKLKDNDSLLIFEAKDDKFARRFVDASFTPRRPFVRACSC